MLLSNYSSSSSITFDNVPSMRGTASEIVEMNATLLENIGNYTLALARCEHRCIVENASEVILEGAITDFFGRIIDWLVAFWKKLIGWLEKKWDALKKWFSTDYKKWYDDNKTYINRDYTGDESFSPSCEWYNSNAAEDISVIANGADDILREIDTAAKEATAEAIEKAMEDFSDKHTTKWEKVNEDFVDDVESEINFDQNGAKNAQKYMLESNKALEKSLAKAKSAATKIISEAKKVTSASMKANIGDDAKFSVRGHTGMGATRRFVRKNSIASSKEMNREVAAFNKERKAEGRNGTNDRERTGSAEVRKAILACYTKGSQMISKSSAMLSEQLTKGRADSFKYLKQYVSLSRAEYSKGREEKKNESSYSLDAFL